MIFAGRLSLANNGGFASIRTRRTDLDLQNGDRVCVRVRGDGRTYSLNLYTQRQLTAFSYRATIATKQSEWMEFTVPLKDFVATSFGQAIRGARQVDPAEVTALGFTLSDQSEGPFKLEVDWIKLQRD